jgi:hypothetical protein
VRLGIKLRVLYILVKCSNTHPYLQSFIFFNKKINSVVIDIDIDCPDLPVEKICFLARAVQSADISSCQLLQDLLELKRIISSTVIPFSRQSASGD